MSEYGPLLSCRSTSSMSLARNSASSGSTGLNTSRFVSINIVFCRGIQTFHIGWLRQANDIIE